MTTDQQTVPQGLTRPLRTQRLVLRPATQSDWATTYAYRRLEAVGRWLTEIPTDPHTYQATFEDPVRLATTVIVVLDGTTIGDLMLRVEDSWSQAEVSAQARGAQAELGWTLDPAHTGHGYATEAVRALVTFCFQDLSVRRIHAGCFTDNQASWRLMERVGMRRESHAVAESLHRTGCWLDTFTYAVLADEWARRRRT